MTRRRRLKWSNYHPYDPSDQQAVFLDLAHLEAFYGGQGGGGKTEALLMAAKQYVEFPEYSALLLMRTYQQLSRANALMDRCRQWLIGTDAQWRGTDHKWTFPSGATIEFGHLERAGDERRYDGPEFHFIGFDELSQFDELQYRFLFTRLRRGVDCEIPLRMRSASNPGGPGHDWVKARFVDPGHASRPFIEARREDNPGLDADEYLKALQNLDPVTRAQRAEGDWSIKAEGIMFQRSWFQEIDELPVCELGARIKLEETARHWDLAATAKTESNDPDWTAGVLLGRSNGAFYVLDVKHVQASAGDVENLVIETAKEDGRRYPGIKVSVEQEPGASGKKDAERFKRLLAGYDVATPPPRESKGIRARPVAAQANNGNIYVLSRHWTAEFLDEHAAFDPDSSTGTDDQVDGLSGALMQLTGRVEAGLDFL